MTKTQPPSGLFPPSSRSTLRNLLALWAGVLGLLALRLVPSADRWGLERRLQAAATRSQLLSVRTSAARQARNRNAADTLRHRLAWLSRGLLESSDPGAAAAEMTTIIHDALEEAETVPISTEVLVDSIVRRPLLTLRAHVEFLGPTAAVGDVLASLEADTPWFSVVELTLVRPEGAEAVAPGAMLRASMMVEALANREAARGAAVRANARRP